MASQKTWMEKTAEYRKVAVFEILQRPRGESEAKAIKRVAAKYNGRALPGKKHLHLSGVSLKRIWQRWKGDPAEDAFNVNYKEGQRIKMDAWLVTLLESYAISNGCTVSEMQRNLKALDKTFPHTTDSLYRHLPETARNRIDAAIKLLRKQKRVRREQLKINSEWKKLTGEAHD